MVRVPRNTQATLVAISPVTHGELSRLIRARDKSTTPLPLLPHNNSRAVGTSPVFTHTARNRSRRRRWQLIRCLDVHFVIHAQQRKLAPRCRSGCVWLVFADGRGKAHEALRHSRETGAQRMGLVLRNGTAGGLEWGQTRADGCRADWSGNAAGWLAK